MGLERDAQLPPVLPYIPLDSEHGWGMERGSAPSCPALHPTGTHSMDRDWKGKLSSFLQPWHPIGAKKIK